MNKINFFSGDKFPMLREALEIMQNATLLAATSAQIGGENYILRGCIESADKTTVSDGLIVINGEILPFKGGAIKSRIAIKETRQDVSALNVIYPETYIFREVQFADNGEFVWSEFESVKTNLELFKYIKDITGDAAGTIKEWAGKPSEIPVDYMLCDGRDLAINDYPELYQKIGVMYGGDGLTSFKLPNAGGRVSVSYTGAGDYALQGNTGGYESVSLEVKHLANHKHIMPWGENPSTAWNPQWGYAPPPYNQAMRGSNSNDGDNSWAYSSDVGEGKPHENRMPYIVFAKIIKVR